MNLYVGSPLRRRLRSSGASATPMNASVSALRFFFGVTPGRGDARVGMTILRAPHRLPVVLNPEAVARHHIA